MTNIPEEQERHGYPWAKALMIIVLYGALLVFLWHFPIPAVETFFRNVMRGFLYIFAGLGLVLITILAFLFFPFPPLPEAWMEGMEDGMGEWDGDEYDEYEEWDEEFPIPDVDVSSLLARSLKLSNYRLADHESIIWEILDEVMITSDAMAFVAFDPMPGVITVTDLDPDETNELLAKIRERLKDEGFKVRTPR
ncbi:MAG: hypothetical protein GVY30_05570 [Chloroflexi bacterium]|jgi:hypothetical protein|nr:hypothetical protein [Chloroflexota bacterium]